MRTRKLIAAAALGALLGSERAITISPALGQAPTNGNSQPLMPSLGGGDGGYGRTLPGPSTTAPYVGPQQPQQPPLVHPPAQPQIIQRSVGPTPLNICQPGGGRTDQTVSIPPTRPAEALTPMEPPARGGRGRPPTTSSPASRRASTWIPSASSRSAACCWCPRSRRTLSSRSNNRGESPTH